MLAGIEEKKIKKAKKNLLEIKKKIDKFTKVKPLKTHSTTGRWTESKAVDIEYG